MIDIAIALRVLIVIIAILIIHEFSEMGGYPKWGGCF